MHKLWRSSLWLVKRVPQKVWIINHPPCRIRSDHQTTSLTLTTGVCETGTKMRGASNMNIHYDVTGLLTAAWRSHSGQIVWAAWINCQLAREEEGGGGFWTHSTYTGYPGSAGGRQLDRWRCKPPRDGERVRVKGTMLSEVIKFNLAHSVDISLLDSSSNYLLV